MSKLESIKERWTQVELKLSDPEIMGDMSRFVKLNKEYSELTEIVKAYEVYKNLVANLESTKEMLQTEKDDEMREIAKEELHSLEDQIPEMEEKIKWMLIPSDPEDEKNAIFEIRAGTGGDEASIFAGDLYRMYSRFMEKQGWKVELIDETEGTSGGYKEIILKVTGDEVYGVKLVCIVCSVFQIQKLKVEFILLRQQLLFFQKLLMSMSQLTQLIWSLKLRVLAGLEDKT